MLKFTYTVKILERPIDDNEKLIETLSGTVEAEDHAQATKQVQRLAFARCKQLERERGDIYGYEKVQVEILPEPKCVITPMDYKRRALRTVYPDLSTHDRLCLCGLGLSGEVGEVTDLLKKYLYHRNGKELPVEKLKDELGDVLWYFFVLLDTVGLTFEEVMQASTMKCDTRHPNGFNPHYASDSHASEIEH